jgi:hypothetical protein
MTTYNTATTSPVGQITTTGGNIAIGTGTSTAWINSPYNGTTYNASDYSPKVTLTDTPLTHEYSESEGKTFQHEVAVIKVTRNDSGEIIKSKMVKVFWVETKTQGSIDYAASKDPEVSELEPEDIIIKTLRTIKL